MRIPRLTHCLLALVCTLTGCTQTGGFRSAAAGNPSSNIRTVASVGDKPIPIVAGEPGLSQRPDAEELDLPASSGARISGRVYDDRGRAVPNAKVRLAVGGSPNGKASYAYTDRSGAFTLRGLRAGSYYTVIAEYQAQSGAMSGRIEAQAPDTNVRISLRARNSEPDQAHSTIRPAKSRVEATADDDDDDSPGVRTRVDRYNSEDVEPPAAEATSMLPRGTRNPARLSEGDSLPPIRAGWNARKRPRDEDTAPRSQSRGTNDEPVSRDSRNSSGEPVEQDDDEGENPLPPALGPRQAGSTFPGDSGDDPPLKIAARPRTPSRTRRQSASPALAPDERATRGRNERLPDREPQPMPEEVVPNARETRPDSFAPIRGTDPVDSGNPERRALPRTSRPAAAAPSETRYSRSPEPSDQTSAVRETAAEPAAETAAEVAGQTAAEVAGQTAVEVAAARPPDDPPAATTSRRPTWRDVSFDPSEGPVDESVRLAANLAENKAPQNVAPKASADLPEGTGASTARPAAPASRIRPTLFQRLGGSRAQVAAPAVSQSICRFDPTDRRLVELQMPSMDGKLVALKDIDADLILLDFWGSWCRECRRSIPHLAELQGKYGENRLRVIGVACEKGSSAQERQASAAKAARALKINYSVLVSSMDGACPVQKAMQIQFYPTMVLLDRNGKIIQREQGATDATLARIDRAIANALK